MKQTTALPALALSGSYALSQQRAQTWKMKFALCGVLSLTEPKPIR